MATHSSILSGQSHGQRALEGYSPWGHKESAWTHLNLGSRDNVHMCAEDTTLTAGSRGTEEPLDEGERGEWKPGLKLNIKKPEIVASGPLTSCQIGEETRERVRDFLFSWAPKSLQMVNAAMKLKDAFSLEKKL